MVTNGTQLKNKAEDIIESGLDILVVSIDGPEEIHDHIRGLPGAYSKAIEGVKHTLWVKNLRKTSKPLLFFNTSINHDNYVYLEDQVEIAHKLQIDGLHFQHLWLQTDDMSDKHNEVCQDFLVKDRINLKLEGPPLDANALYLKLQEIRKKYSFVGIFPDLNQQQTYKYYERPDEFIGQYPCRCSWLFATVQPDGRMTLCKEIVMGNLCNATFNQIWNGEQYRKFRKNIRRIGRFPIYSRCCYYFRRL